MPTSPSFEEQIRAYNEELRRYYAQSRAASHPEPKPEETHAAEPEPAPEPPPQAAEPSADLKHREESSFDLPQPREGEPPASPAADEAEAADWNNSPSEEGAAWEDVRAEDSTKWEEPRAEESADPNDFRAEEIADPNEFQAAERADRDDFQMEEGVDWSDSRAEGGTDWNDFQAEEIIDQNDLRSEDVPPVEQNDLRSEDVPPVERPWEAVRAEEWMNQILHPQPVTEFLGSFSEEEAADVPADEVQKDASGKRDWQAPPFGNDPPQPVEEHADTWDQPSENSDIGYLQVRVFSARGAVPLVGAIVSVIGHNAAGQEMLLHMNRTDISGIAPPFTLPTPDRALSYKPGDATPFLNYIVQVSAPGYVTIRNERVAIYGGVTSLQGVPMIPLPEPQVDYENEVVIRPGGAPPELN